VSFFCFCFFRRGRKKISTSCPLSEKEKLKEPCKNSNESKLTDDLRQLVHDVVGRRAQEHVKVEHAADGPPGDSVLAQRDVHAVAVHQEDPVRQAPRANVEQHRPRAIHVDSRVRGRRVVVPERVWPAVAGQQQARRRGRLAEAVEPARGGQRGADLQVLVFQHQPGSRGVEDRRVGPGGEVGALDREREGARGDVDVEGRRRRRPRRRGLLDDVPEDRARDLPPPRGRDLDPQDRLGDLLEGDRGALQVRAERGTLRRRRRRERGRADCSAALAVGRRGDGLGPGDDLPGRGAAAAGLVAEAGELGLGAVAPQGLREFFFFFFS